MQVRKCRLFNVTFSSTNQTEEAVNYAKKMILHQNCSFYILDNFDPLHFDSIPCNLYSFNAQIDLATQLFSCGLAQYGSSFNDNTESNRCDMEKRTRRDIVPLMDSLQLKTFDDFKLYYETYKLIVPINRIHEDDDRIVDKFERLSKRSPLKEKASVKQSDDLVKCEPNPMVDRIIEHFTMYRLNECSFACRVLFVVDPITVLIVPANTHPPTIHVDKTPHKYCPLNGTF